MKKGLLTTTALVAAAMLSVPSTADAQGRGPAVKLNVQGYMDQIVGVAFDKPTQPGGTPAFRSTSTAGRNSFDVHSESEIHFDGRAKLDNGIMIRAHVEFEVAGSPGNLIDEEYALVRGNFGQITIGNKDGAANQMTTGWATNFATGVGLNLTFDAAEFVERPRGFAAFGSPTTGNLTDVRIKNFEDDATKISYFTPRFVGFQFGVSWAPNNTQDSWGSSTGSPQAPAGALAVTTGNYSDVVSVGTNYVGKVGKVRFGIAGGWMTGNAPQTAQSTGGVENEASQNDPNVYIIGGRIDIGGLRAVIGYKRTIDQWKGAGTGVQQSENGWIWNGGVRYTMGANVIGLNILRGEEDGTTGDAGRKEEVTAAIAAYGRNLAPGVRWHANIIYADYKNDGNGTAAGGAGPGGQSAANNVSFDGWAIATGLRLTF